MQHDRALQGLLCAVDALSAELSSSEHVHGVSQELADSLQRDAATLPATDQTARRRNADETGEPRGLPEIAVHTFRSNALGTFVAIDAAQRNGVGRFLCASSINAFGTFFWRLSGQPSPYVSLPLDEGFRPVPEDPTA